MKKINFLLSVLLSSLLMIPAVSYGQKTSTGRFARKAVRQMVRPALAAAASANETGDEVPTKTVVNQHFDQWTRGTNETPDATMLGGEEKGYNLEASLMGESGWTGNAVYQAGGACAIRMFESEWGYTAGGFISTPEMSLYGEVVATFRARRLKAGEKGIIRVALCDNYEGPVDDRDFEVTDVWQEYTFATDKGTFNPNNIFQFSAEDVELLLDDIVVTRKANRMPSPKALAPINNSPTSFTARWSPMADASSYQLHVYRKEMPSEYVEPGTVTQGFDGINVNEDGKTINQQNPNYPAGWTVNVSANGSRDVYTDEGNYSSAPQSICFDAEGDEIISPEMPAPITSLSFWIKPSTMETESDYIYSLVQVGVYTEGKGWETLANLPNYWLEEDGFRYSFTADQLGDNARRVRLYFIQKNSVDFAIDDIEINYESLPVPVGQLDKELTDTCYTMDIDPNYEYYYNVKAKNGSIISAPSEDIWVDGLVGLKPEAQEATEVTERSFKANWTELHNADRYKLNVQRTLKAEEDLNDMVVLHEDFDNVHEGTLSNPYNPWLSLLNMADAGYASTEWILQLPYLAEGMAGARETSVWTNMAGLVVSPKLTLTNDGGAFDVDVKAYNTYAGDTLFVMLMNRYDDDHAVDYRVMPLTKEGTGLTTATIHFDATDNKDIRSNVCLAFMSMYGQPYFIDEVTIRQNLRNGETLVAPYATFFPTSSGYAVTELDAQCRYAYDVTALATRDYKNYASETSDLVYVLSPADGISSVQSRDERIGVSRGRMTVKADNAMIEVYDLQGRRVAQAAAGEHTFHLAPAVYLVRTGNKAVKVVVP